MGVLNYAVKLPICTCSIYCGMLVSFNQERKEISSKIVEYVNGYEEKPLALYGNSGSGKTYVMAHAACMLKEKFNLQNACIVVRFLGTSHHSSCIRLLLRSVCQQVKCTMLS